MLLTQWKKHTVYIYVYIYIIDIHTVLNIHIHTRKKLEMNKILHIHTYEPEFRSQSCLLRPILSEPAPKLAKVRSHSRSQIWRKVGAGAGDRLKKFCLELGSNTDTPRLDQEFIFQLLTLEMDLHIKNSKKGNLPFSLKSIWKVPPGVKMRCTHFSCESRSRFLKSS